MHLDFRMSHINGDCPCDDETTILPQRARRCLVRQRTPMTSSTRPMPSWPRSSQVIGPMPDWCVYIQGTPESVVGIDTGAGASLLRATYVYTHDPIRGERHNNIEGTRASLLPSES